MVGGLAQTAVVSAILWTLFRGKLRPRVARLMPAAAVLVTVVDLAIAQSWLMPYAPAEQWTFEPTVVQSIRSNGGGGRVFRESGWLPPAWQQSSAADRQLVAMRWDRETLWPKYHLAYQISEVEASSTLAPFDYQVLLEVARAHGEPSEEGRLPHASVLDLLGARVAILAASHGDAGGRRLAMPADAAMACERPGALPRAWVVHDVETMSEVASRTPGAMRKRTEQVLFPEGKPRDWRRMAVIETDEPLAPVPEMLPDNGAAARGAPERVEIVHEDPLCVEIDADLERAGVVVLADLWYPGWELTVHSDDASRRAPILRANRVMRGAALSAGHHRLVFRYRPTSVFLGATISGFAVAGLCAAAVISRRRRVRSATGRQLTAG